MMIVVRSQCRLATLFLSLKTLAVLDYDIDFIFWWSEVIDYDDD